MSKAICGLSRGLPLAIAALLGLASAAQGQPIVNPSFEDNGGSYGPAWYLAGNASVESVGTLFEGASGAPWKTATDGTWAAMLQTNNGGTGQSSSNVVNAAALETFLGQAPGFLTGSGYVNGSGIKQTFTALAGSTLKFDANFLTNELSNGNQDAGFAYLFSTPFNSPSVLLGTIALGTPSGAANATDPLNAIFPNGTETLYQLGLSFGPADFASDGTYAVAFAIYNKTNGLNDSAVTIDNLSLTPSAVPLPAGVWAGLIGMALSLAVGLRMRRAQA